MKDMSDLFVHRFYWNRGNVGDGKGYSNKLSIKGLFLPRQWTIGFILGWDEYNHWFFWLQPLPMISIRFHYTRSYGGRYV